MMTLRTTGSTPSRGRHIARVVAAIGLAGIAVALTGCSDDPSPSPLAPQAPKADLLSTVGGLTGHVTSAVLTVVNGVTWTTTATQTSATATIGSEGGAFGIPGGVQIVVPRGAVPMPVRFSVTRLPGNVVAYDFQPHGTTFAVPLVVTQPTAGTNLSSLTGATFRGAYFPDQSLLNQVLGTAQVSEFEPTVVAADKSSVTFTVKHFSGYIVSWGRNGEE